MLRVRVSVSDGVSVSPHSTVHCPHLYVLVVPKKSNGITAFIFILEGNELLEICNLILYVTVPLQ
jgi:hypothetical protein